VSPALAFSREDTLPLLANLISASVSQRYAFCEFVNRVPRLRDESAVGPMAEIKFG
jgi:hypothetical protein